MRLRKLTVSVPLVRLAGPVFFMVILGTFGQSACGNPSVKERSLRPWERQYKIKPNEKNRLTPADVLGPGVSAKTASFDHIVKDNVFVLKDGKSPMIFLATSDCIGAEIIGNGLYGGNGRFVAGRGKPAVVKNNKVFMLSDSPRPIPEVPSIYEWQQKQ